MPTRSDGGGVHRLSRRALLAGGAALAGGGATAGLAASRQVTRSAVIQQPDRFADENLAGFVIQVTDGQSYPATPVAVDCDLAGWPSESVTSYDAHIIDRKQADTPPEETVLYISDDLAIPTGRRYLINTFQQCGTDYVGVQLEGIDQGTGAPVYEIEDDERPNTPVTTSAVTPGFGIPAALGGLLGVSALLRRWGD